MFSSHYWDDDQIMIFEWRKWKQVYNKRCFTVPKNDGVLQLEGGAIIRGNSVCVQIIHKINVTQISNLINSGSYKA